jgi:hypothetical protein
MCKSWEYHGHKTNDMMMIMTMIFDDDDDDDESRHKHMFQAEFECCTKSHPFAAR